jgi:3',5'-nucleoside bisphosphate phosphatase
VKRFAADLHIHTALSPCASEDMAPREIVRAARNKGLAMIAICDHNSTGNVASVQQAAGASLTVLAGMEVTTAEEVHVLGLFPDAVCAAAASACVQSTLPEVPAGVSKFGPQRLMNAQGQIVGMEPKLLVTSSALNLSETVEMIHAHGGLAIAAHADRPSYSVMSQLGLFPIEAGFDAIEVSAAGHKAQRGGEFESFGLPVLTSSDSHFPTDIGDSYTVFELEKATFAELVLALKGKDGRRFHRA